MKRSVVVGVVALVTACSSYANSGPYKYANVRAGSAGATAALALNSAVGRVAASCRAGYRGVLVGRPYTFVVRTGRIYSATATGTCQYAAAVAAR